MAAEIIAESAELGIIVGYSAIRGEYWTAQVRDQEASFKNAVVLCRAIPSEENGRRIPSVSELLSTSWESDARVNYIIEVVYRHNTPPM